MFFFGYACIISVLPRLVKMSSGLRTRENIFFAFCHIEVLFNCSFYIILRLEMFQEDTTSFFAFIKLDLVALAQSQSVFGKLLLNLFNLLLQAGDVLDNCWNGEKFL